MITWLNALHWVPVAEIEQTGQTVCFMSGIVYGLGHADLALKAHLVASSSDQCVK